MPPSPTSATRTRTTAAIERRAKPATTATTAPTASPTGVSPSKVPTSETGSSHAVRWPANQRDTSSSGPSIEACSGWVSTQPHPTTTSASTTYAVPASSSLRAMGSPLLRVLPRAADRRRRAIPLPRRTPELGPLVLEQRVDPLDLGGELPVVAGAEVGLQHQSDPRRDLGDDVDGALDDRHDLVPVPLEVGEHG